MMVAAYRPGYVEGRIILSNMRVADAGLQGVHIGLSVVLCLTEVGARTPCQGEMVCPGAVPSADGV